ncbi:MAG: PorP/SprF family type IX secretion system membrane protein [Muribaculaceae bacterium]|nr:PorP/SprF family type IX secretion system membrane protein [Muribaculaceae bacterium]
MRTRIFNHIITVFLSLFSIFTPIEICAQADMIFTQHWALPTLYNPARSGDTDFLRIAGGARLQWIGVHNAPKSFTAAGDMPFAIGKKRIGAGVTFSQESLGLFSNLLVSAQGSYRFKILGGVLAAGLQVGYYNSRFRGSDVYIPGDDDYHQPTDPSIPNQDLSGNAVDFTVGVNYTHKFFHVGVAAAHITSPTITLEREGSESNESQRYETSLPRTLYFDADGNIALENTLFQLQPSLLAATDFKAFSAEISLTAKYNKFISAGLGYRWKDALSIMIGAEFKNFFLGYAFDYPLSAISRASSGSHEIVAGYRLKLDLSGKNKNRHRSIRIM